MFKYNFIFLSCFLSLQSCNYLCNLHRHDTYRHCCLQCRHPSRRLKLDWNFYVLVCPHTYACKNIMQSHTHKIGAIVFSKKLSYHHTWTFLVWTALATFQNLFVSRFSVALLATIHCALSLLPCQVLLSITFFRTFYCCLPFSPFTIN